MIFDDPFMSIAIAGSGWGWKIEETWVALRSGRTDWMC